MIDDGYLNLADHDSFANGVPHKTFARLRKEEPVAWTDGDDTAKGFWSLTRHADIAYANRESSLFSSGQGIRIEDQSREEYLARRTFQETDPPEHSGTRRKVNPAFAKPVVAGFEDNIRSLAVDVVESAVAKTEFDAVDVIAKQLPMLMLGRILGVPNEDLNWLIEKGDALIGNTDPDFTQHVVDKIDTDAYRFMPFRSPAGVELYDYADEILGGRKPITDEGVLARIIRGEDGLTGLDFKNFFCLLVAAGNDTTRYSIAMSLYLLATQPELLKKLQTGQYWDTVADEVIRLASPTMHFRRTATQDIEFHGKQIKEGDKVLLWFVSGSRDEEVFENPDLADLGRTPNRHLAFGQGGAHVCLGMHLAKLEVRIMLEELSKRISSITALSEPSWTRSNFICGVKELDVKIEANR